MIGNVRAGLAGEMKSSMDAARLAFRAGDFPLSAKHYKKIIALAESNALGEAIIGEALIYLSICHSARKEFREAEVLLNKALAINESDPQCDDILIALNYHELSVLYWKTARETESQSFNEKAQSKLEHAHTSVAELKVMILRQKAVLLAARHEFTKADAVVDAALDICERSSELGKNSLAYGESLITKVFVYIDSGRLEEAKQLYFQAIQVTEMCLGVHHPKMADLYEIFAKHFESVSNNESSEVFRKKSKEIRDRIKQLKW